MENNQNYYNDEIDLMQMILFCLKKWKSLVALVLAGAVLGGMLALVQNKSAEKAAALIPPREVVVDAAKQQSLDQAKQRLESLEDIYNSTKLFSVDTYKMHRGLFNAIIHIPTSEVVDMRSELHTYFNSGYIYDQLAEQVKTYNINDLKQLVSIGYEQIGTEITVNAAVCGASKYEAKLMLTKLQTIIDEYFDIISDDYKITNYISNISEAAQIDNGNIRTYQSNLKNDIAAVKTEISSLETEIKRAQAAPQGPVVEYKSLPVYAIIGAILLAGVYGVWLVMVFLFGGKLYAVSNVEGMFRTKILGDITVDNTNNPVDKLIFKWMNGRNAGLPAEDQEKIVLLNIKNELSKAENIKNIMLVSSMAADAEFIRAELAENGYNITETTSVIANPAALELLADYDAVLVVENKEKTAVSAVKEEFAILKDYNKAILGLVLVNR